MPEKRKWTEREVTQDVDEEKRLRFLGIDPDASCVDIYQRLKEIDAQLKKGKKWKKKE